MIEKHPFELEKHRLSDYKAFAERYGISDLETLVGLYEIDDLQSFLPPNPSPHEKAVLNELIGVKGVTGGYMDYQKSNHTFELIMQWQEATNNHDNNAISFQQG
ncbi:MAG: hypothetical protein NWR72_21240 [Bacteroidia bacterium]|nr:hypothetical protein [Bacteroidia bacterium]